MNSEVDSLPVRVDGDRTRAAILSAAQRLFVEHGFAATSMAGIAKQAGVTKSLIHHHFGSKRELWDEVKATIMEEYGRRQQQLMSGREPDLSLLEESFVAYFTFMNENPDVVRLWSWMAIERDSQCAELSRTLVREGIDILRRAQRAGYVRADVEPEAVLAQFFSLVRGWFLERPILQSTLPASGFGEGCDERYLRATLTVFLDGLRPR